MSSNEYEHENADGIRIVDLKNQPVSFVMERLDAARRAGSPHLDVLNRGRPVLHLSLASELPEPWRVNDPKTLPLTDLKRSRVSLVALKRDGRAFLLTQRSGPTLALWPVAEEYARPADAAQLERLDYLEREVKRLGRENRRLGQRIDHLDKNLSAIGATFARLFKLNVKDSPITPDDVDTGI